MTAAGHMPRQLRSAPKKNPRKKNSSAIGATTATRKATADQRDGAVVDAELLRAASSSAGSSPKIAMNAAVNA